MTPHEFIKKWKPVALTERQTAQEHFIDLCRLVNHPTPVEDDPAGKRYCFEKGAAKSYGNPGFADVWKQGYFAFEYKKKKKNLGEALKQLSQYAWNLENPPLNVVCDTNAIKIVTAWTNTLSKTFDLTLDDLADPEKFAILHAVFHDPEKLRGHMTREMLTKEAANKFSGLAERLQSRGHPPEAVAHFIMHLVFCFFAEDVKLLPEGFFRKALKQLNIGSRHEHAKAMLDDMFCAMATKGGRVGNEFIAYFNGGLFDGQAALSLDEGDLGLLVAVGSMQWAEVDPSIFGTLFERFLDPAKRAQIGAHYTDAKKILQIVDPVIMRPLEAEWAEVKARIEKLVALARDRGPRAKEWGKAEEERGRFVERLASLRILDPACGSGNFLYMALQRVKDLEFRVINECEKLGLKAQAPRAGPEILFGIEINRLAAEIARTTIWIGDIQWGLKHALYTRPEPVLRKLDQIECRDAVLAQWPDGRFVEAQWPKVDFIIGNPPFLGGKVMRDGRRSKSGEISGLGHDYVDALFTVYKDRVPAEADFVCYWFAKAWEAMQIQRVSRAGLVATNSIRGGANRRVLDSIAGEERIFEAWGDEPWIIEGAAVRVSLVCFGDHKEKHLDGSEVARINADLTGLTHDITQARQLPENANTAFMGDTKGGAFDVPGKLARAWLKAPINPNARPNSDVLKQWVNGLDLTRRPRDMWIVDFGWTMSEKEATFYEEPFAYILEKVKPEREKNRRDAYRINWWRHMEARPAMWSAISTLACRRAAHDGLARYIVTPRVSKHRVFIWVSQFVCSDSATIAIARDDDTTFGILHSRFHEAWSLRLGTSLEDRPRYTPTTTFETFPFPEGLTPNIPAADYAADPRAIGIAEAAKKLDDLRGAWLNPPDLIRVEPEVVPGYPDRILPKDADAAKKLKGRTPTNLYNLRPQWLADAHQALDRAVAAAYGWPEDISTEEALEKLLALNLARRTRQ
jgi:type II restriction/modification system DNA methylase subunit YeeA